MDVVLAAVSSFCRIDLMFKKVIMTLYEKNFGVAQEARNQLGPNIQVITDKKPTFNFALLNFKYCLGKMLPVSRYLSFARHVFPRCALRVTRNCHAIHETRLAERGKK